MTKENAKKCNVSNALIDYFDKTFKDDCAKIKKDLMMKLHKSK